MGGKGYKSYTSLTGKKVSGDWEDSDRGAGNRATRRAGGEVKAKSPTYIAHVINKGKKKVDPKKNPAVKEHHQTDANGKVIEHGDGTPSSVEEDYYKGTGEKVVARTREWMKKKGQKGAPGLDAMKARTAEHKAKRGVKEEVGCETKKVENKGKKKIDPKKNPVVEGSAYGLWKGDGKRKLPGDKKKKQDVKEAKVDKGRSDYGKATIRNWRHSGPSTVEPAMFDPENKRGKTIDKRREEHKARRGVKGAKVPTYKKEEVVLEADKKGKGSGTKDACYHKVKASAKVWPSAYASGRLVQCRKKGAANYGKSKSEEFEYETWKTDAILEKVAAWQRKEGKNPEGGLNQKGVDSYRRENPGSKLKTAVTTKPSKLKKGSKSANRRKSFCARMSGMKKKLTSAKTANDPDSRINKSLRKWNCSYEPDGTPIMEEDKAFNFVLDKIRKEVGKDGYVSKNNPRKPQTPQQKAKVRAHQAKVDAENAAERKKDPSQGRYPKG